MEWISVEDKFPEIGQQVVYIRDVGEEILYNTCSWSKEDENWMKMNNITHWMLLPEPPKERT